MFKAASGGVYRRVKAKIGTSAPVITVGPTWTNNMDGTATFAVTTDVATTLSLGYDTSGTFGTIATDGSGTSHSITLTAVDGTYLYKLTVTASGQNTIAYGIGAITSSLLGHFMIFPHAIDTTSTWHVLVNNQDGSATGIAYALQAVTPSLGGSVRVISQAYEGAMYPGVVFNYAYDTHSGTIGSSTSSPFRFWNLGIVGAYIGWTVPSWVTSANGFSSGQLNTLYIACDAATSGHMEVHRIRATVDVTIAADVTPAGTGYFSAEVALSAGNELQAGDTVYIRTITAGATEAVVGCLMAFSSTGTFLTSVPHRVMNKTAQVQMRQNAGTPVIWNVGNSSAENAWEIAPTGSAVEFVGGAAHQGPAGTYGQEFPSAEVWTKSGVTWTPAQNYYRETLSMVRTSTAYYNVGNTNIGTMVTTYTMKAGGFQIDSQLTYNVNLDTANLYAPMLPLAGFATAANTFDGTSSQTCLVANLPITWTAAASSVTWAYGSSVVAGVGVYATAGSGSTINSNKFLGNLKNYQELNPATATNAVSGTVKRGTGTYFELPSTGPVAPTISATSCVVDTDGHTIMVRPVTTTGNITGNTGLTFKRTSGTPATLTNTSVTNNADGTLTVVITELIASGDTITVDVATASLYDAFGIMMAAQTATAVVNHSAQ